MKILLLHNYYRNLGGEDIYFLSLYNLLKKNGHVVEIFTRNNKDIKPGFAFQLRVAYGMLNNGEIEESLSKKIISFKPDIVHSNNIFPLLCPAVYSIIKKFSIPIVQRIANFRLLCPKGTLYKDGKICELCIHKRFYYPSVLYGCYHNSRAASLALSSSLIYHRLIRSFSLVDGFVFQSQFTRDYYVHYFPLETDKTAIIPHFVDYKSGDDRSKKSNYFLFAGRFSEEKGIIELLRIFSMLPKINLIAIGDGPLEKEALKYKKYKNIKLIRQLPQTKIFEYMSKALCTIIPSRCYETGPLVLMESFAQRTSVIVPRHGSFKDAVQDTKTGLFYEPGNDRNLKEKILFAWENKKIMYKMGLEAKKEFNKKYSKENHYHLLMDLYTRLIYKKK